VGTDNTGKPRGLLGNPAHLKMIGNFPVSRLAAFADLGFDRPMLERVLVEIGATTQSDELPMRSQTMREPH
jgi:hypothetical protein